LGSKRFYKALALVSGVNQKDAILILQNICFNHLFNANRKARERLTKAWQHHDAVTEFKRLGKG
jgi:hypothetical protein